MGWKALEQGLSPGKGFVSVLVPGSQLCGVRIMTLAVIFDIISVPAARWVPPFHAQMRGGPEGWPPDLRSAGRSQDAQGCEPRVPLAPACGDSREEVPLWLLSETLGLGLKGPGPP